MKQDNGTYRVLSESDDGARFPIRPAEIPNLSEHAAGLLNTFGKTEVEKRAERLVHFFVLRGRWCSFTLEELLRFYESRGWNPATPFFGLAGAWFDDGGMGRWAEPDDVFITCDSSGNYFVTDRFVERCAQAADRGGLNRTLAQIIERRFDGQKSGGVRS